MDIIQERRGGFFTIDKELIFDQPDLVMSLLSNFLIVRAEMNFMSERVEYQAYSPLFKPTVQGGEYPHYDIIIDDMDNLQVKL